MREFENRIMRDVNKAGGEDWSDLVRKTGDDRVTESEGEKAAHFIS